MLFDTNYVLNVLVKCRIQSRKIIVFAIDIKIILPYKGEWGHLKYFQKKTQKARI